uniref:Uncharacterized protein n=1 Tax=Hyaloperonospora arabidopsidis (strain Emoy2) TaxID=559515 RepID=M4C2P6_HYAAE
MISLHHDEGHFYDIHYGERFLDWNNLPGREMRLLLDDVHSAVGVPRLDRAHDDADSLRDSAQSEAADLLEEIDLDPYASGSQESTLAQDDAESAVVRFSTKRFSSVHLAVYERILTKFDTDSLSVSD